jgi:hypothetical protein
MPGGCRITAGSQRALHKGRQAPDEDDSQTLGYRGETVPRKVRKIGSPVVGEFGLERSKRVSDVSRQADPEEK